MQRATLRPLLVLLLAFAAVGLGGCGSSSGSTPSPTAARETSISTPQPIIQATLAPIPTPTPSPTPPSITAVSPNPVPGSNRPQSLTIEGIGFSSSGSVTLRNSVTNATLTGQANVRSASQIEITTNFTTSPAAWTVEVSNEDGTVSERFPFMVAAPSFPPSRITTINPSPVVGATFSQEILISGDGFRREDTVLLRDLTSGQASVAASIRTLTTSAIAIQANVGIESHIWSVEVVDQLLQSSGPAHFHVISPSITTPLPRRSVPALDLPSTGNQKLVLVTHGWAGVPVPSPAQASINNSWVTTMANDIVTRVGPFAGWDVTPCLWTEDSRWVIPSDALASGQQIGMGLANRIYERGYRELHLIGHSAGGGLVQGIIDRFRERERQDHRTAARIHVTFLDAYVGILYGGKHDYGVGADWAEQYCGVSIFDPFTDAILTHAFNFYVTLLNPYPALSPRRHAFPHEFYQSTVTSPLRAPSNKSYGFPLSSEAGWWNPTSFPAGLDYHLSRGTNDELLISQGWRLSIAATARPEPILQPVAFESTDDLAKSEAADVTVGDGELSLKASNSAWVAKMISVGQPANAIKFKIAFDSRDAPRSRASIFWNNIQVGTIQSDLVLDGYTSFCFQLPGTYSGNTNALSVRLHVDGDGAGCVRIKDVFLGAGQTSSRTN